MTRVFHIFFLCVTVSVLCFGVGCGGEVKISPVQPAAMAVNIDGKMLEFDAPEIRRWSTSGAVTAPRNHASWYEPWQPWPRRGKDRKNNTIELGPRRDSTGTQILGGLFKSVQPESVVVKSSDGSRTFVMGKDFILNETWGQIANLNGGLGAEWTDKITVECRYAMQRLDLIQRNDSTGTYSVKRGESAIVCPGLPSPDSGHTAIAGIYIAPWRHEGQYLIDAENILPINPKPPVEPVNPKAVARTLKKLRSGEPATIAIMGASIASGAEATRWWDTQKDFTAEDTAWRGRVIYSLRQRYPQTTITPVTAYRGGTTTQYGLEQFNKNVAPEKPDLVMVSFGGNDASSSIGGKPRNSPEKFKALMTELVSGIKAAGCEVMIVITMPRNPWLKCGIQQRWPKYRDVMLEIGREQDVAVADVYSEWENLDSRGIPYYTQLHNWNNHPGDFGHKVFADTILRFFDKSE